MKCALFLTLFVAAAAQDGGGSQSQGDSQSQGSQSGSQSDNSYGYEAPAEQATQSYAAPTESYAVAAVVPKCCVSACPGEAPFFNPSTCSCVPGYVEQEAPQYMNYGAQTYGNEQSYGESTQQSGYRKLQAYGGVSYGAPEDSSAPVFSSGPDGTIDTRGLRITRTGTIVLWIAFAILFLLACYYLRMFHWYYSIADGDDAPDFNLVHADGQIHSSILHFLANPSLIAGCVCLIASLAYLTMATNNGWYTRCHDGRQVYFARYIDWIITTPLMLHALAHFANSPDEIWNFLFFSDVLMIVSGLVASTIDGPEKWIYYGFSILAFIPVLYYICRLRDAVVNNRVYHRRTGLLLPGVWGPDSVYLPYIWFFHNYNVIADLTVLAWFCYPIVWIFAEGTNKLSA